MKLLGINITAQIHDDFEESFSRLLLANRASKVGKINTGYLLRAVKDPGFAKILNSNTVNIADGRGVQWAAKYLSIPSKLPATSYKLLKTAEAVSQMVYSGAALVFSPKFVTKPIPEVFPGVEALELMLSVAEKEGVGVFFFGASDDVLNKSLANIQKKFPKLKISGSLNGYGYQYPLVIPGRKPGTHPDQTLDPSLRWDDGGEEPETSQSIDPVKVINDTDAKLLIVALGSPKQEYWISDNLSRLTNVRVAVGEGGTLDRIANPGQKAPKWLNRVGLEWLWRLFFNMSKTDGRNRFQRFWEAVPVFICEVVKWKIRHVSVLVDSSK